MLRQRGVTNVGREQGTARERPAAVVPAEAEMEEAFGWSRWQLEEWSSQGGVEGRRVTRLLIRGSARQAQAAQEWSIPLTLARRGPTGWKFSVRGGRVAALSWRHAPDATSLKTYRNTAWVCPSCPPPCRTTGLPGSSKPLT